MKYRVVKICEVSEVIPVPGTGTSYLKAGKKFLEVLKTFARTAQGRGRTCDLIVLDQTQKLKDLEAWTVAQIESHERHYQSALRDLNAYPGTRASSRANYCLKSKYAFEDALKILQESMAGKTYPTVFRATILENVLEMPSRPGYGSRVMSSGRIDSLRGAYPVGSPELDAWKAFALEVNRRLV